MKIRSENKHKWNKKKSGSETGYPDSVQITQCYGKECLRCVNPCPLHECGVNVIREKQDVLAISNGRKDTVSLDEMFDMELDIPEHGRIQTTKKNQNVLDVLNRIAFLYIDYPRVFDGLIRRIYLGQNQTQIAKDRGLTRAAISKELREGVFNMMTRELGIKTPIIKRENLLNLTAREFEVYKLSGQGYSEREISGMIGISKSTVHRVGQSLSRKLSKNGAPKNMVLTKNTRLKAES